MKIYKNQIIQIYDVWNFMAIYFFQNIFPSFYYFTMAVIITIIIIKCWSWRWLCNKRKKVFI